MGFSDIDSTSLISQFEDGIDYILNNFSQVCVLEFPDKDEDCPNCGFDPWGKRSTGVYTTGGPIPFTDGQICPYCNGRGRLLTKPTSNLSMIVIWESSQWMKIPALKQIDVNLPDSTVQTWGYFSDLAIIRKCDTCLMTSEVAAHRDYRFRRLGEGLPQGLKNNRYFVQQWQRLA